MKRVTTPTSSGRAWNEGSETPSWSTPSSRRTNSGERVPPCIYLVRYELDSLKKEWNDIGKIIRDKKKANKEDPCAEEIKLKNENEEKQKGVEETERLLLAKIDQLVNSVGNIVHDSVPVFNNEDNN